MVHQRSKKSIFFGNLTQQPFSRPVGIVSPRIQTDKPQHVWMSQLIGPTNRTHDYIITWFICTTTWHKDCRCACERSDCSWPSDFWSDLSRKYSNRIFEHWISSKYDNPRIYLECYDHCQASACKLLFSYLLRESLAREQWPSYQQTQEHCRSHHQHARAGRNQCTAHDCRDHCLMRGLSMCEVTQPRNPVVISTWQHLKTSSPGIFCHCYRRKWSSELFLRTDYTKIKKINSWIWLRLNCKFNTTCHRYHRRNDVHSLSRYV